MSTNPTKMTTPPSNLTTLSTSSPHITPATPSLHSTPSPHYTPSHRSTPLPHVFLCSSKIPSLNHNRRKSLFLQFVLSFDKHSLLKISFPSFTLCIGIFKASSISALLSLLPIVYQHDNCFAVVVYFSWHFLPREAKILRIFTQIFLKFCIYTIKTQLKY